MITIYHNSHCSKSRAALEFVQDRGHDDVQVINYLSSPPSEDTLRDLLRTAGLSPPRGNTNKRAALPRPRPLARNFRRRSHCYDGKTPPAYSTADRIHG